MNHWQHSKNFNSSLYLFENLFENLLSSIKEGFVNVVNSKLKYSANTGGRSSVVPSHTLKWVVWQRRGIYWPRNLYSSLFYVSTVLLNQTWSLSLVGSWLRIKHFQRVAKWYQKIFDESIQAEVRDLFQPFVLPFTLCGSATSCAFDIRQTHTNFGLPFPRRLWWKEKSKAEFQDVLYSFNGLDSVDRLTFIPFEVGRKIRVSASLHILTWSVFPFPWFSSW